jgi:hypothetical protein
MKKLLNLLLITLLLTIVSCGSSSFYSCDGKVGVDKDLCIEDVKRTQEELLRRKHLRTIK